MKSPKWCSFWDEKLLGYGYFWIFFPNGKRPQYFANARQPHLFGKGKTIRIIWTSTLIKGGRPNIWQIEDDLNILAKGRQPQFIF